MFKMGLQRLLRGNELTQRSCEFQVSGFKIHVFLEAPKFCFYGEKILLPREETKFWAQGSMPKRAVQGSKGRCLGIGLF